MQHLFKSDDLIQVGLHSERGYDMELFGIARLHQRG